jgi:reductive dehalogenase
MLSIEASCNPTTCSLECIKACKEIHGESAPLYFSDDTRRMELQDEGCTACLKCVRACPFDAIRIKITTPEPPENPPLSEYAVSLSYEIADSYTPFSEENIIFARVQNDPEFSYFQKPEDFGAVEMISKGIQGYSHLEHKVSRAGWELYDFRHLVTMRGGAYGSGLIPDALKSDSELLTRSIKQTALFIGAVSVGITKFDRRWLYSTNRVGEPYNVPESIKYAIVALIEMDYDAIATSPAFPASAATALGYSKMAFVEIYLTAFIRHLGFNAIPCGNDVALSVPLAIDAGLGQYGRHGLLITKDYGSRVRIAKVLTDMPLLHDEPDHTFNQSVIRFCEDCEKCAEHCPNQCIPFGKDRTWEGKTISNNPGVLKWYVNVESCYGFWLENGSDCSNCIRACPYNKRKGRKLRSFLWLTKHAPWLNKLIVKIDDVFGGGKQQNPVSAWKQLR